MRLQKFIAAARHSVVSVFLASPAVALGQSVDGIQGCPQTPNCVSSSPQADDGHHVLPFRIEGPPSVAWDALKKILLSQEGVAIVEDTGVYIHAEATSKVFKFVDDLGFQLDPDRRLIHVRSASRAGYWDFGVNRKRIEALRKKLAQLGVIG
jgi:uncharacterized protein (DUF1499 family)